MPARLKALACSAALVAVVFLAALAIGRHPPGASGVGPTTVSSLFAIDRVWTVELSFGETQWAAMEPGDAAGPFGGGRGGRGGPGQRGGPGGDRGDGPAGALASALLDAGDTDEDWQLSRAEVTALAEGWFRAWDGGHTGTLHAEQLRAGLGTVVGPFDGPPGGAPRAGPAGDGEDADRNGIFDQRFPTVKADLRFAGQAFPHVSVRYKGNNTYMESSGTLKRSMKVDLNDGGYDGRKLGGASKLNLHNNVTDAGWMNEVLSYRLFRDAAVPAPRTSYARVFVTVPGLHDDRYLGLYSIVENPDNNFARERFGTKKGAIFKPVTRQIFEDVGDRWTAYARAYDAKTPVSSEETQRVIDFAKLVSHASDREFDRRLEEFLDIDEFARFMAVTVWLSNMDSILGMAQNYLVYLHPKTRQFQFLPWDLDHSFGQFPMMVSGGGVDLSITKAWSDVVFLDRVFKVDRFKRLYLQRMREFSHTIFSAERFARQVEELAPVVRPAVAEESSEKLKQFDQRVLGTVMEGPRGAAGPEGPPDFGAWGPPPRAFGDQASEPGMRGGPPGFGGTLLPIKAFAKARAESVAAQLANTSEGVALTRGGGPRGGPPGGGPGRGGPDGPGGFGPATFMADTLLADFDADGDQRLTAQEFLGGFTRWFDGWDTDGTGVLSRGQLASGLNDTLRLRQGPPRGGAFRRE